MLTRFYVMGTPPDEYEESVYLSPAIERRIDAERIMEDLEAIWFGWHLWIEEEEDQLGS